jgi:CheY-like chemotaxis protein
MAPEALATQPDQRREAAPLSILIAEDSEITLNLLRLILTQRGHSVECVGDGEAAGKALADGAYDVCLIDFHLPKRDGLQVVRSFRDKSEDGHRRPCFIGMTADIEGLLAHPANCETLDMIFSKPIVAEEVYAAIERTRARKETGSSAARGPATLMTFPAATAPLAEPKPTAPPGHYLPPGSVEPLPDRRRADRKVVSLTGTTITKENGESYDCRIVSLSFLGASLHTACRLLVGERIMVGRTGARVVRVTRDEVAVEFVRAE